MNFVEINVLYNSGYLEASTQTEDISKQIASVLSNKYDLAYFRADESGFTVVVSEDADVDSVKIIISDEIKSRLNIGKGENVCKISQKSINKTQLAMLQLTKPATPIAHDKKPAEAPAPEPQGDSGSVPIEDIISKQKSASESSQPASTASEDAPETTISADDLEEIRRQKCEERVQKAKGTQTLEKIRALIGADEFKALAEEIAKIAPVIAKNETYDVLTSRSYLFSIGDGNGLTTYLNLLADLLEELGLFTFDAQHRIIEHLIEPESPGVEPFKDALGCFKCFSDKAGRLICFDISEWLTQYNSKDFRAFLSKLPDYTGKHIIIFRVPFLENEVVKNLNSIFNDRLCMRQLTFLPFDNSELVSCAKNTVKQYGYTVSDDVWDVFNARITEEKNDGRFYGIETVNKVVREMIYLKQLSSAYSGNEDSVIKKDEVLKLSTSYNGESLSGLSVLDSMVGMEDIKQRVIEITSQIEMAMKNDKLDRPCIHMRFVGNPGTGKTTVARVLGQILKEKGILRNGSFFEHAGREFCGRYIGETAPKTAAMCRDAYGSVLFIDEAYTLYRGDGMSRADYGREALDTLISEMENHRTDLVVIMAGYPDEMKELMKANPGLESRMPFVINFPNYTRQQLISIFMGLVNKTFACCDDFEQTVTDYFSNISDDILESKDFSNARFVRNLFERTWGKSVLRAQMNKSDTVVLEKEDFLAATSDNEFTNLLARKKKSLGFV
ncbi:MAG: AAA family ATPase [Ruminococcus sp.]|nr:AAA family ATPase [Ruminococcus sp.]